MDKFFGISERNSTVRAEIIGGITTFFALAYIVFVAPNQVAAEGANGWLTAEGADPAAMTQIWNSVFIASIIAAAVGTLVMACYAKMPFAQACGMGLNSFFCTCFVSGAYFAGVDVIDGYQAGLVIILLSGIIFLILSVTGVRQLIARSMPECLKKSISAGIGLFIALVGMKGAGIITANPYTLVSFVDIHGLGWEATAPALTALIGFLIIAILAKKNVKGNVLIGIVASTILYYVLTQEVPAIDFANIGQSFRDFGSIGLGAVFHKSAWEGAFFGANIGGVFSAIALIISFTLVDMFDTLGTLYGTAAQADMLDENGDPINLEKAMMSDSVGTTVGALMGTSTITTFVESTAGVASGAKTGLASVVTSICLLLCLFVSPLAAIVPSAATAPALIYVGVLMMQNFSKVDMQDLNSAVPAFLTLIMMPLTYSISNGIGIGAIAYVIMQIFTGKFTKKDIIVTVIAVFFVLKFITVSM